MCGETELLLFELRISIRCGIHTGEVLVGNMGRSDQEFVAIWKILSIIAGSVAPLHVL